VIEHAKVDKPHRVLIEDAGVGTALIQELKRAHFSVIPVKPERDKVTRMSIQTGKIERSGTASEAGAMARGARG